MDCLTPSLSHVGNSYFLSRTVIQLQQQRHSILFELVCKNFAKNFCLPLTELSRNVKRWKSIENLFLNGPFPASFYLFYSFQYSWQQTNVLYKCLPMTGFELKISCVRSDRFTNWAKTSSKSSPVETMTTFRTGLFDCWRINLIWVLFRLPKFYI